MVIALLLLGLVVVGLAAALLVVLRGATGPRASVALPPPGSGVAPPLTADAIGAAVDGAVGQALAEVRRHAAAERDAAVQAALQHAAVLQRETLAQHLGAGQQQLADTVARTQHELASALATGNQDLAAKKDLIDTRLDEVTNQMRAELQRVGEQLAHLGTLSTRSFGEVNAALAAHTETTQALAGTANSLREALASTKSRGQWGERMAEDVLRMAGFVENVNYRKQTRLEGGAGLPDYTFELPKGQVLYLDVKFPLSAYLRYLDAGTDAERSAHRDTFLRDVRLRVRELAKRDYARQGDRRSVDYVLLFLPNETVSTFIHENDATLLDDALRQKVVFCSPLTLFAMLGVIRQAHDNFMIEQTSDEILRVLGRFDQQWGKFVGQLDVVGKRLDSAQRAYEDLNGTRRRQLEKPLYQLEQLRAQRGIELEHPEEEAEQQLGFLRELGA